MSGDKFCNKKQVRSGTACPFMSASPYKDVRGNQLCQMYPVSAETIFNGSSHEPCGMECICYRNTASSCNIIETGWLSQYSHALESQVSILGRYRRFFITAKCPDRLWGPASPLQNGNWYRAIPSDVDSTLYSPDNGTSELTLLSSLQEPIPRVVWCSLG